MVTVSSAFISSRRDRIRFRVSSATDCAFETAASWDTAPLGALRAFDATVFVDALFAETLFVEALFVEALDDTAFDEDFDDEDLDNTDAVRDHSFHCIASTESRRPTTILRM